MKEQVGPVLAFRHVDSNHCRIIEILACLDAGSITVYLGIEVCGVWHASDSRVSAVRLCESRENKFCRRAVSTTTANDQDIFEVTHGLTQEWQASCRTLSDWSSLNCFQCFNEDSSTYIKASPGCLRDAEGREPCRQREAGYW